VLAVIWINTVLVVGAVNVANVVGVLAVGAARGQNPMSMQAHTMLSIVPVCLQSVMLLQHSPLLRYPKSILRQWRTTPIKLLSTSATMTTLSLPARLQNIHTLALDDTDDRCSFFKSISKISQFNEWTSPSMWMKWVVRIDRS
jgi:hypothetical protein